jgi:hypothetical protein
VPFLIPALARKRGCFVRIARFILILAPLIAAVTLAAQHEVLAFD